MGLALFVCHKLERDLLFNKGSMSIVGVSQV